MVVGSFDLCDWEIMDGYGLLCNGEGFFEGDGILFCFVLVIVFFFVFIG